MANFKIGDKAVHPKHGVGEVTSIESREISGNRTQFYSLRMLGSGEKVLVATRAAEEGLLRQIISRNEAKKVLDVLRSEEVAVTAQPWNRRSREYNEMLHSGSPFEVAKVVRDLTRRGGDKELSYNEKKLLKYARTRLVTELAIARRCKESRVENDIDGILGVAS